MAPSAGALERPGAGATTSCSDQLLRSRWRKRAHRGRRTAAACGRGFVPGAVRRTCWRCRRPTRPPWLRQVRALEPVVVGGRRRPPGRPVLHDQHRPQALRASGRRQRRNGRRGGAVAASVGGCRRRDVERSAGPAEGGVPVHRPGRAVRGHGARAGRVAADLPGGARPVRRGVRPSAGPAAEDGACSAARQEARYWTRPATPSPPSSRSSTRWPNCGSRGACGRTS